MSAYPTTPWRPPARPVPPPLGYEVVDGNTLSVPGLALVIAHPYRRIHTAEAFARRIAAQPAPYLDVLCGLGVDGIIDLRPASHARGGSPFGGTPSAWSPPPRDVRVKRLGRPATYPVALVNPHLQRDRRAAVPVDAAGTAEAVVGLSAVLDDDTVAAVADCMAGGELPAAVADDLGRRFTREQFSILLGIDADGRQAVAHG